MQHTSSEWGGAGPIEFRIAAEHFAQRDGIFIVCGEFFIKQQHSLKRSKLAFDSMVLILVISFVEERRAYIYDRLHLIDDVIDIVCAQIRCKRVHDGTHLKAGQINNAEICPFGHLKGNDVAILHADFLQPRCELACAGHQPAYT